MMVVLRALVSCEIALAANSVAGELITFTNSSGAPNGAWSWFEGERVVIDASHPAGPQVMVSSVSSAASGAERGDIDVHWYNTVTAAQGSFELHDQLQSDDHDSAALWVRPDGHYVASYSKHGNDSLIRFRISTSAHDPTSWSPEFTFNMSRYGATRGSTYSNLYYLPNDDGGNGRLYNFNRNNNLDPNILVSSNRGSNWSYGGKLLTEGDIADRPYVRYFSNGDKIHFITTEEHPGSFATSIYHGYVNDGKLYNSKGTVIDGDLLDGNATAVAPADLTTVFANGTSYGGTTMNRAWTVDVAIDSTGYPYAIFTARAGDLATDHRFFYARFDGASWSVSELAAAGGFLYSSEDDYTGLAALDPNNPNTLYISTDIDPRNGSATNKYEIYQGETADGGKNWTWIGITEDSAVDNLRPVVPEWDDEHTALLWMRGNYNAYTDWDTEVVGIIRTVSVPEP